MRYRVRWTRNAERDLKRVPKKIQEKATAAAQSLESNPRPSGVTKMKGKRGQWRISLTGGTRAYRLVYTIDDAERMVLVLRVASRGSVY